MDPSAIVPGRIYESVAEKIGLGCFAWPASGDAQGFCSEQASKIFAGEVHSSPVLHALLDSDGSNRLALAMAAQAEFTIELKLRNSRWVELSAVPDNTGAEPCWIGTVADITHRVARWRDKGAGEELYRDLAENSPAMLWMGDANAKCIFLNSALREFWGIDPQDLSTFDWSSTTHPDDIEKLAKPFVKAMADHEPFKVEARYLRSDGAYRTMRTEARPRFDQSDGAFLGMSGVNTDITDRLEAEQRAAESARLRNAIMQVSPDAIVTVDAQGRFIEFNPGAERIFGHARADVIGRPMEGLIIPAVHRARHVEGMARYLSTGEARILGQRVEMTALRADGSEFPAEIAVVRIPLSEPAVFTAFIRDVSARKAAEDHTRMLMGELNHRTKNILSVVQAVARQTARHTGPGEFLGAFDSRLFGLSASNDLLMKNDWSGVDVADLLDAQLGHLDDIVGTRLKLSGPAAMIEPKAAQALGMAIHELSTNSLKHGALSHPEGTVTLQWEIAAVGGTPTLSMNWHEHGVSGVVAPTRKGFGHSVIVDMVAAALDADVELDFRESGVQWSLRTRSDHALIS